MPGVINGIGTWYWGKSNVHGVHSICGHCGGAGELISYDTRTYFVFFFIPIIPLGRKRVLEECPSCKRHNVVKYRAWQHLKQVALPEAVAAYRSSPQDRELATTALDAAIACQDEPAVNDIAAIINARFARDAELQAKLGGAYEYFSQLEGAEGAFRASMESDDQPAVRNSLARNLILQSKPDEAWDLISNDLAEGDGARGGLAMLVAESYQTWGMHDAAQTVLDTVGEALPALKNDRDYKKLQKKAKKYSGTSKVVKSKLLAPPKSLKSKGRTWGSYVPMIVALFVVTGLVATFVVASLQEAANREVYIVNGLSIPYRVSINGQTRNLRPNSRVIVRVPEGDVAVSVLDDSVAIPDQSVRIETGFFTRVFTDHLFVINPDRTALLFWEETTYSENPNELDDSDYSSKYYSGDFLVSLSGVDYPFQKFPDQISLSTDKVRKDRIIQVSELAVPDVAEILSSNIDRNAAAEYVIRKAELDQDDLLTLAIIPYYIEPKKAITVYQELCAKRPIRLEAHRVFQTYMERLHPEIDLVAEYRDLLAEAPDDTERMYLLGRILPDQDEAEAMFQKATSGSVPSARAFNALAYSRIAMADFDAAREFSEQCLKIAPEHRAGLLFYCRTLAALGRFDEALNLVQSADPYLRRTSGDEAYFLSRTGNRRKMEAYIRKLLQDLGIENDPATSAKFEGYYRFIFEYVLGDLDAAMKVSNSVEDASTTFARAIIKNDLERAGPILDAQPESEPHFVLLLSMLFRDAGNESEADRYLSTAVEEFQTQGFEHRRIAAWLSGASDEAMEEALRLVMEPNVKAVMLVALGRKFPEHRDQYFELARKLNFDRRFPYWTVQELIKEP
ncbi:MAG: tetratricopeptide repeat protein [Planctomycetes bacterium]|nr:tetratricopeptide repeat protein [Planctomycetota bacterium]